MNDFVGTLKTKFGPLPVWAWAGLGTALLAVILIRRKGQAASSDQAAADQTNSNLGSASELANMFEVAGLMPYQGGDIYINTTSTNPPPEGHPTPPPPSTTPPKTGGTTTTPTPKPSPYKPKTVYTVKKGDNLTAIAKKYGISEAELWKFNTDPKVRTKTAIATLKARGQNLIFSGEKIYIPTSSYK